MRNLRKKVRLVHKLAQLAGTKKLLYCRHHGLRIDEVVWHCGLQLGESHLFLDRPLHPHKTDPELIFKEFADAPDSSVAKMVYIIHFSLACPQAQDVSHNLDDILVRKDLC